MFVPGPTRWLKEQGFPINNDQSDNYDETQLKCLEYDLKMLEETRWLKKVVIFERCILDTFAYTFYLYSQGKISEAVASKITAEYRHNKAYFDAFVIPSHKELKYENDGVRNEDMEFREDIAKLFRDILYTDSKFHFIEGSMYVRMGYITDLIQRNSRKKLAIALDKKYFDSAYPKENLLTT